MEGMTDNHEAMAASSSQPETMKAECSLDNPKACYSESSDPVLHVTLLGGEWGSSAGGLSTINRELAIHLSNHSALKVSLLVPEGACNTEEIREADGFGITIVEAKERAAFDRLHWLSSPPQDHVLDIVVGHGVKLGRQVQFIRDSARFPNCKWVQVVHTAPEDLSRYKCYSDAISKGETKHESEVELCKLADLVVPVGPRLKEAYISYLQRYKTGQDVLSITPGLFQREFGDLIQTRNEHAEFKVLLFGRGDDEDFELKGYNIAAQAFTDQRLKNKPYHLIFVGAPEGKQEKVREKLLQREIAEAQLTVRKFLQSREKLKDLLCEVDLAIMPSKSEGFGLVALEALSAGLPILVGSKSGFAKALEIVLHGNACIVNSDDPAEWAKAIEAVRIRHGMRLQEIKSLRASYEQMYSWKEQCEALVNRMLKMSHEDSLKARSSLGSMCNASQRMEGMTDDHEGVSPPRARESVQSSSMPSIHTPDPGAVIDVLSLVITTPELSDEKQASLKAILEVSIAEYTKHHRPSTRSDLCAFIDHMTQIYKLALVSVKISSLIITVKCPTLESLERLWKDYQSGCLNGIAERFLVTDELKRKLGLDNIRLKTTIEEENYLLCKRGFLENSGVASITETSSQTVDSGQVEDTRWSEVSSDVVKDKEQALTPMARAEKAKIVPLPRPDQRPSDSGSESPKEGEEESEASKGSLHRAAVSRQHEMFRDVLESIEDVDLSDEVLPSWHLPGRFSTARSSASYYVYHSPITEKETRETQVLTHMERAEKAKTSRCTLHKAAISGQYETVKMLLESGEHVDQRDQVLVFPRIYKSNAYRK